MNVSRRECWCAAAMMRWCDDMKFSRASSRIWHSHGELVMCIIFIFITISRFKFHLTGLSNFIFCFLLHLFSCFFCLLFSSPVCWWEQERKSYNSKVDGFLQDSHVMMTWTLPSTRLTGDFDTSTSSLMSSACYDAQLTLKLSRVCFVFGRIKLKNLSI